MRPQRVVVLDWSAASKPTPARPSPDAIWIGQAAGGQISDSYHRTRAGAEAGLHRIVARAMAAGERLLIGADFPFGYPAGFAAALTGTPRALALWDWLATHVADGPDNANNRFALAAGINERFPGLGPFWGHPATLDLPGLPERGSLRSGHGLPERRLTESLVPGAQPCWKLYTTGSVGSQALLGIPALQRLRAALGDAVAVWPFEPVGNAAVVLAEVYPSLLRAEVRALEQAGAAQHGDKRPIRDAVQVRLLAAALEVLASQGGLAALLAPQAPPGVLAEEGWILGIGQEAALRGAAREVGERALPRGDLSAQALIPPRLRDDCFAMPQGVEWMPVDEALVRLRDALVPVGEAEEMPLAQASGRVLAAPVLAARANPPAPNSAVDGYGLAHAATGPGINRLPLLAGRAAAGAPYPQAVPPGHALRILTGAILPEGVDTVVLEEDCATDGATLAFDGPLKPRANTRRAGEDVAQGAPALPAGRRLGAPDLALLSALGVGHVPVWRRLRVAVLSTGDEVIAAPAAAQAHQIFDANRPMLLDLVTRWGYHPVDLGCAPDDPAKIAARLDRGARQADVILTSGGASAGDEDHVSRLLRSRGRLTSWRIAMKPGRPLVLAQWGDVPVFGLPGNPVAAFVCALIFARPALGAMAGAGWAAPQGFSVPAAFEKRKKPGRREYLRARLNGDGAAQVFGSEGSGRISGLAWAEGLVELPDGAVTVRPGDPVRYLPFGSFGM